LPLHLATTFELSLALEENGWGIQPQGKGRVQPYAPGDVKVWYCKEHDLPSKAYLQCLLQAEALKEKGVTAIEHFKSVAYYQAILQVPASRIHLVTPTMSAKQLKILEDSDEMCDHAASSSSSKRPRANATVKARIDDEEDEEEEDRPSIQLTYRPTRQPPPNPPTDPSFIESTNHQGLCVDWSCVFTRCVVLVWRLLYLRLWCLLLW